MNSSHGGSAGGRPAIASICERYGKPCREQAYSRHPASEGKVSIQKQKEPEIGFADLSRAAPCIRQQNRSLKRHNHQLYTMVAVTIFTPKRCLAHGEKQLYAGDTHTHERKRGIATLGHQRKDFPIGIHHHPIGF